MRESKRTGHFRAGLIALNLVMIGAPAVASADTFTQVRTASCFAFMFGRAVESASAKPKKKRLAFRGEAAKRHTRLRGMCLINEIATACRDKAMAVESSGAKKRALIYYNKACSIGTDAASCRDARRVARSIGCNDPRSCESPSGKQLAEPFSRAAARTAFADATDRIVSECENDAQGIREVKVSALFATSGKTLAVTVSPTLEGLFIDACIQRVFRESVIPAFEGEARTATMTVSLAEVPSAYHLVDAR